MKKVMLLVALAVSGLATSANADLIITEYICDGNNKALELYNNGSADLTIGNAEFHIDHYKMMQWQTYLVNIWVFEQELNTLNPGETFVIVDSGSDQALKDKADYTTSLYFDGNDIVKLRYNGSTVDTIGQQVFPLTGPWGDETISTMGYDLRRKPSITTGDTNVTDAYITAEQWNGFAANDYSDLGVVPEPTTMALVCIGGLAVLARRRNRK